MSARSVLTNPNMIKRVLVSLYQKFDNPKHVMEHLTEQYVVDLDLVSAIVREINTHRCSVT